ncbi:MAG: hypothetical protein HC877_01440 [Thioploca sp.]|nr:hypothetical protein [Thioploca sp.]
MKDINNLKKIIKKYRIMCDEAMANPRHRSPSIYQLPSWKNVAHLLDELEKELKEIETGQSDFFDSVQDINKIYFLQKEIILERVEWLWSCVILR